MISPLNIAADGYLGSPLQISVNGYLATITIEEGPEPTPTPTPSISPTVTPSISVTPTLTVTPSITPSISTSPLPPPLVTPDQRGPGGNTFDLDREKDKDKDSKYYRVNVTVDGIEYSQTAMVKTSNAPKVAEVKIEMDEKEQIRVYLREIRIM